MSRYSDIKRILLKIDVFSLEHEADSLEFEPLDLGNEYVTFAREPHTMDNDAADAIREFIAAVDHTVSRLAEIERAIERGVNA